MQIKDLRSLLEDVRTEDRDLLTKLFGVEDGRRYRCLERMLNTSQDFERANVALKEMEEMQKHLSPSEQDLLFGVNQMEIIDSADILTAIERATRR